MIHVYIWMPGGQAAWGHCSMWIQHRDPARERYVSWWPLDYANIESVTSCNAAWPQSPSEDVRLEGRQPTFQARFANTDARLDEDRMVLDWDFWTRRDCYSPAFRNCCTTVAQLLRESGGAARIVDAGPLLYWDTEEMLRYVVRLFMAGVPMRLLGSGEITLPPDSTPRAPNSWRFREYEHGATAR